MPDVQKQTKGFHKIPIQKVGVRNIEIPFSIPTINGEIFNTYALVSSYCDLVEDIKGINMSRISRTINKVLNNNKNGFTNLNDFVYELKKAHKTNHIFIRAKFNYIIKVKSPITELDSYEPTIVIFESILEDNKLKNYLTVRTTEMSLCPCSKEMSLLVNNITDEELLSLNTLQDGLRTKILNSGFGAHNQKSNIEVKIELNKENDKIYWIEDLINTIKKSSSCPTFTTLKRPDEKYITEVSYMGGYYKDNKFIKVEGSGPKFVEDIARDISEKLNKELNERILDYLIVVNNEESIHSSNITATAILNAGINLK